MKRLIALTGFMGSGKSTVGARLARALGVSFYDLDKAVEARRGGIAHIFSTQSERRFREYERDAFEEIVRSGDRAVVALGGGALTYAPTRKLVRKHAYSVFLHAPIEQIARRVRRSRGVRPLLGTAPKLAEIRALYKKRLPVYRSSDAIVRTSGLTPAWTVRKIAARLRREGIAV